MSSIKKISLEKTIDYSQDSLKYFCNQGGNSSLISYQQIINKIRAAKECIKIATTNTIIDNIYDALYGNNDLKTYIIFNSFDNSTETLSKFDNKNPIVARKVNRLENNFIIIDDISFLLINPLSEKENFYLQFDENKTQDLNFIFNYYFWNCASLEKLVDTVLSPIESPFPPFDKRELNSINIVEKSMNNFDYIFIPRDKKFNDSLDIDVKNKCFSEDIKTPIYLNNEYTQIGDLYINQLDFDIKNFWKLKESKISEINTEINIIPREKNWHETIKIKDTSIISLNEITAKTIDDMENTEPSSFPKENYIKSICYKWVVLPPTKPSNAKKSSLYIEYDKLANNFKQRLSLLEKKLEDLKQDSGSSYLPFLGANKQAIQNLNKISKYKEKILYKEKPNELREFFTQEFKYFFEDIMKSEKEFKNNKKEEEAKGKWEQIKKQKNNELTNKEKEIKSLKNSLKDKNSNQSKSEIKLKKLESNANKLSQEIKDNYTKFEYKPNKSELSHLSKEKIQEYKNFTIPVFALPEVGVLYETNDSYFLEIQNYEQLDKAKELQQRYKNKNYDVVVGDCNE